MLCPISILFHSLKKVKMKQNTEKGFVKETTKSSLIHSTLRFPLQNEKFSWIGNRKKKTVFTCAFPPIGINVMNVAW